jgi:endonuclease/exonuclease/phosphatase (EEP) superfamily protein YafD
VMMTSNLLFGEADAAQLVATLKAKKVDVFAAQELTAEEVARLRAAGIESLLPYSALSPGPRASGTGLWSRYSLGPPPTLPTMFNHPSAGYLELGDGRIGPLVVSIHSASPWPTYIQAWNADLISLRQWLAGQPGSLIVAGDFNATVDHKRFRNLLSAGVADAATQVGAGNVRTYPAKPHNDPVIGIDHVLVGTQVVATSFHTQTVAGSDHRGVVVHLLVGVAQP